MNSCFYKLLLFTVFQLSLNCFSQFKDNYIPIKSEGLIPYTLYTQLKSDSAEAYFFKELVKSGKVLFGDPVTLYTKGLTRSILKNRPELFNKLSIYTLKSLAPTIMISKKGELFITTGLLARLENEAQLAFLILREIAHFSEGHIPKQPNNSTNPKSAKYTNGILDMFLTNKTSYSKKNNYNADKIAIQQFIDLGYVSEAVFRVYEILETSYLPFEETKMVKSDFENDYYYLPNNWNLEEVDLIIPDSTRKLNNLYNADILARQDSIFDYLSEIDYSIDKGEYYLKSEKKFTNIKTICRFELIKSNLAEQNYTRSIYNALFLLKNHPNNAFLHLSMAKAFYGLYKCKKYIEKETEKSKFLESLEYAETVVEQVKKYHENFKTRIFKDYKDIDGNEKQIIYLISKMTTEELNIFALKYFLDYENKFSITKTSAKFKKDIVFDLITDYETDLSDFKSAKMNQTYTDSIRKAKLIYFDTINRSNLSKYDLIKLKKQEKKFAKEEVVNFKLHLLAPYLTNASLSNLFEKVENKINEEKEAIALIENDPAFMRKYIEWDKQYGNNLEITKLLTVSPFYLRKYGETNGKKIAWEKIDIEASRKQERVYANIIEEESNILNIENKVLVIHDIEANNVEKLNELTIVNEWFHERVNLSYVKMIPLSTEYCHDVIEKYNTSTLFYSGIIGGRYKKESLGAKVLVALFFWYILSPILIALMINRDTVNQFHLLLDMETGEVLVVKKIVKNMKTDRESYIKKQIRKFLLEISQAPTKVKPSPSVQK